MSTPPTDPNATPQYSPPPANGGYQAPPYAGQAYPSAPSASAPYGHGAYQAPGAKPPGQTMGIVAIIVVFFSATIGIILGVIAMSQSKAAGIDNTPAKIAVILGIVMFILQIVAIIFVVTVFLPYIGLRLF